MLWANAKALFRPNALLWFRTCLTLNENSGRLFAERISNHLNVRVAGHTVIIGAIQNGLVQYRPGSGPAQWSDRSGVGCLPTDMSISMLEN